MQEITYINKIFYFESNEEPLFRGFQKDREVTIVRTNTMNYNSPLLKDILIELGIISNSEADNCFSYKDEDDEENCNEIKDKIDILNNVDEIEEIYSSGRIRAVMPVKKYGINMAIRLDRKNNILVSSDITKNFNFAQVKAKEYVLGVLKIINKNEILIIGKDTHPLSKLTMVNMTYETFSRLVDLYTVINGSYNANLVGLLLTFLVEKNKNLQNSY